MKMSYLNLMTLASLSFVNNSFADTAPQVPATTPQAQTPPQATSNFTSAQLSEIEKVIGDYLTKHPDAIMNAFQSGMEAQQKKVVAKMEKAVAENKDKIFNDTASPIGGNPKGTQSLVVFTDPICGYCKKFHGELDPLLSSNKDVKIIFKEIPIMGGGSTIAIKALLAAKTQNKYDQLQKAVYSSDKPLTKKQVLKLASSVGIDTKKLEEDMKNKAIQAEIDQSLELAKIIGINGTPTLIIGETKVVPGYMPAADLNKLLKETSSSTNTTTNGKAS